MVKTWYSTTDTRTSRVVGNPDKTRVLLMGDSIAQGIYGNGSDGLFADQLNQKGFSTQQGGFGGTGLLDFNPDNTPGPFQGPLHKWCKALNTQLNSFDPDIVVFWYRGNYKVGGDAGQPGITANTLEFFAAWQNEALHMTSLAKVNGRQVIFGLGPAMTGTSPDGFDYEVQTRGVSNNYSVMWQTYKRTGYLSGYKYLPDPWALNNCEGVQVRDPDGLHMTPAGWKILADAIIDRIIPHD